MNHKKISAISLLNGLLFVALITALVGAGEFTTPERNRASVEGGKPGESVKPGAADDAIPSAWVTSQQRHEAMATFRDVNPNSYFFDVDGSITRVFGKSFSRGGTPQESAAAFIDDHIVMLGVTADELAPIGRFEDGRHLQPIMYDAATDTYKFTGVYFTQERAGVPVFRSELVLLTRNEPGSPLVLASSNLKPLGDFQVPAAARAAEVASDAAIRARMGVDPELTAMGAVIWAGTDEIPVVQPRLAYQTMAEFHSPDPATYQKWLFLTDAQTGQILYEENQVLHNTVTGNVSCQGTTGFGADICGGIATFPMPYARVTSGANTAYADANGNYALNTGGGTVSVTSMVRGLYFVVNNQGGGNGSITEQVNAPGTANFMHNALNTNELTRAEVNAYVHANVVRDFALQYNPQYPTIANQTQFSVNVNMNSNCNAFYNGSSINFYTSGGGCSNTANTTVVYHEYGHHLVNTGGSGQGAYGEGMSDSVAIVITDDPMLGQGFNNNCATGLRNADNDCQYQTSGCSSCGSQIHACGRLMSGCVWSTRTELLATHPLDYRDIISNLTINSILLHTGTSINPSITIDFLTLDDDDDNIMNGTPHYNQIHAGFGAHNMPGPELDPIKFSYPEGLPEVVTPGAAGTTIRVVVEPLSQNPVPGTGMVHYRVGGGPFTSEPMQQVATNVYDAVLPSGDCGDVVDFYVSAQASNFVTVTDPSGAPSNHRSLLVATGLTVTFADDFNEDLGWIAGVPDDDATTGHWVRANPVGTTAQPSSPFVGDACYITGQHPGGGAGANDVDNGKTTLVTPLIQLEDGQDALISYMRWYSNHAGANPFNDIFVIDITNDNGASWVNVETIGPSGPQVQGGWWHYEFRVSSVVEPTDQIRLRFVASDYNPQALIEAAVDQFRVKTIECDDSACPGDLDGSGAIDVQDLLTLLSAWGTCDGCPEDLDSSGAVDVQDLLILLGAWGPCPE